MAEKKNKKPAVGDYPEYLNPPFVKPALPQRPDKKDIEENTTPSKSAMDALARQAKDNEDERIRKLEDKAPTTKSEMGKKAGGTVKYARGGGIEQRGKTRGKIV